MELICHHKEKNKTRYLFLTAGTYTIGKALDNDIVLLESSARAHMATLQKVKDTYVWKEPLRQIDLQKSGFETHGYHFRIRNRKPLLQAFVFCFFVLIILTLLQWFVEKPMLIPATNAAQSTTQPDPKSSGEMYIEAEKLFHDRHIRKGNLIRCIQLLEEAKQIYESKAMPTPGSVHDLLQNAQSEKKKLIQDHRAMAQKFSQQGDWRKSRKIYEKLLDELVNRSDPDRLNIENEMRRVR